MNEIDRPLNFHGNSEIEPAPCSPYNTPTIGVDNAVWEALKEPAPSAVRGQIANSGEFAPFGMNGGEAARKFAKAARQTLHHQKEYKPCRFMTAEEYEQIK